MAGEIQLNSTTMATESSGSITAQLDTIRPNTTNGSLTLQGDSSDAGVTGLTIDSSGNATFAQTISAGTIGSSVVFPAGHMILREIQTEWNPQNAGGTRTNAATTLSVTPLSTTSKFLVSYYGSFSAGSNTAGTGATGLLSGKYSLNSDMSSASTGASGYALSYANYFNSTSGSTTVTQAGSTFYVEFELTHNGNTYYFNANVDKYGSQAYLRPINIKVIEVF